MKVIEPGDTMKGGPQSSLAFSVGDLVEVSVRKSTSHVRSPQSLRTLLQGLNDFTHLHSLPCTNR